MNLIVRCARGLVAALVLALALAAPRAARAQLTDVIRGRITGPDSLPVAGAEVVAATASGAASRAARTGADGRFTITFPAGAEDYVVTVTALGFVPKRYQLRRVGDETLFIADARLARPVTRLDTVRIFGDRPRVQRGSEPPDVGGTERAVTPWNLRLDEAGLLAAMAASIPGVQLVTRPDGTVEGFSVLGLGADQNRTTLNGMDFGAPAVPRDAAVTSSLATAPYDPARGGFSGAQFNLATRPGSNFESRVASVTLDAPPLQWTDRAAAALGQRYSNVSLGGQASGPLRYDRLFYDLSYQLTRRESDLRTLLGTDAAGLRAAGVSADSAERLRAILRDAGVPLAVGDPAADRVGDQGLLLATFTRNPSGGGAGGHALSLVVNGAWDRQAPVGVGPTAVPAAGGERTDWNGGLTLRHSAYFAGALLSETSLGVRGSRSAGSPFLEMPGGQVRVGSTFRDGANGLRTLAFGGNAMLDAGSTSAAVTLQHALSWFSRDSRHRLKLTSELRHEGYRQRPGADLLGTFAFNSLGDLEAKRPASFTRQLAATERSGGQLVGALSLGDAFRATPDLQLQYGVRADASRFDERPAPNAALERALGVHNDVAPARVALSPRLGFTYAYGPFRGGARPAVRGGVGVFQGVPATTLLAPALANTGLPGGVREIRCVGDAAPVPDWAAYAADAGAIPDRCADGSDGTVFSSAAPTVRLLAGDFAAPRSVRSNLQWTGPILGGRLSAMLDGTWSRTTGLADVVDRNFDPAVRFRLDAEGGRPVFAAPEDIVAATGSIAPGASRRSDRFASVLETRSALAADARQLTVRLAPAAPSFRATWSLS